MKYSANRQIVCVDYVLSIWKITETGIWTNESLQVAVAGCSPGYVREGGASRGDNQVPVVHTRSWQKAPSAPWPWPLHQITLSCVYVSVGIYNHVTQVPLHYHEGLGFRGDGEEERLQPLTFHHLCGLSGTAAAATSSRCGDSFQLRAATLKTLDIGACRNGGFVFSKTLTDVNKIITTEYKLGRFLDGFSIFKGN